jgi:hypothetical protein
MQNITLIEGWALIVGNVRVYTSDSPTLEEVYKLPTVGRYLSDISKKEEDALLAHSLEQLKSQIKELDLFYPESAFERMYEKNEGTTLGPFVWLTCSLMAIEVMKALLNWGHLALAPNFALYNPISHK